MYCQPIMNSCEDHIYEDIVYFLRNESASESTRYNSINALNEEIYPDQTNK